MPQTPEEISASGRGACGVGGFSVNTDTQRIITGEMGTVINIVSGRAYTVSVMAVVDDSQRSEPDRERVTAGGCRKD